MKHPIAIDLFAGSGGLTLGLKQAGFRVIGAIEIDPLAAETYRFNHSSTKIWEKDIRKVRIIELMKSLKIKKGELDLLAGCPPCQGFSTLRTLNGNQQIKDPRNSLIFEFIRFVKQMKPKTILLENVPHLAKDKDFEILGKGLEKLGYSSNWKILNASDFGVPQRRQRLILLAGLNGNLNFKTSKCKSQTVRKTIDHLPPAGNSGDPLHDLCEKRSLLVRNRIKLIPQNGGSRKSLKEEYQLACHKKGTGFKDVYGRMSWDKVSPTITGGCINPSKGRFLHPSKNRAITLREAALLQSFPRNYYFSLRRGKHAAAILIGNALPPKFVKYHGLGIKEYLTKIKGP